MEKTEIPFSRIHEIFSDFRKEMDTLVEGIKKTGHERSILENFLEKVGLEINSESLYAAYQRISQWKFDALENYAQKQNFSREKIDELFETSYLFTRKFVEEKQEKMLKMIREESLLPEFYMTLLEGYHEIGKSVSDVFLAWNKTLIFGVNRQLEADFGNDHAKILAFLEANNLFDTGHFGQRADRSYSILQKDENGVYHKRSYFESFPKETTNLVTKIGQLILDLDLHEDELYNRKSQYIAYFQDIVQALTEMNCNKLVERWSQVDAAWMKIDTPFQPGHMMECYEDKYRKAVSIEFDFRIDSPNLFESEVHTDIRHMYESFWDEMGRENEFSDSYHFSKHSFEQVQLHIGVPYFSYGSFLCGMYSAQVVPNDTEVSKIHGKKIFAFPSFVLAGYKSSPRMKLETQTIDEALIQAHHDFLFGEEKDFFKIYDISTIGHEFGHTLWLTPDSEVIINFETGLFKNIEEFKATAGGMVAYFLNSHSESFQVPSTQSSPNESKSKLQTHEQVLVECLYRNIRMMKYREVEDVVPYYCECLISLHIFYTSGIISLKDGKISLDLTQEKYQKFRELYIRTYKFLISNYLQKKDASDFLFHYVLQEGTYFLPIEPKLREWVNQYYALYKEIGNDIDE